MLQYEVHQTVLDVCPATLKAELWTYEVEFCVLQQCAIIALQTKYLRSF
jgi:hypothetical protein